MKTYADALAHYNKLTMPPRSKKWKPDVMPDNGKPIRRVSETHFALHKTDAGVIYYRLYDTHIATFYPPQADGTERRTFKYVNTQTSNSFMWSMGLHFYMLETTEGKEVRVPYVMNGTWAQNNMLTADLVFDSSDKLVVEKSWHKDIYTFVSSPADKSQRKALRDLISPLVTLATFKIGQLKDNAVVEQDLGIPFGSAYGNQPRDKDNLGKYLRNGGTIDPNNPQFIDLFMSATQDVFNSLASRRAYKAGAFNYCRTWGLPEHEAKELEHKHKIWQQDKRLECVESVTAEVLGKSLTNMLVGMAGLKTGNVKKPWGQFMDTIPAKWYE